MANTKETSIMLVRDNFYFFIGNWQSLLPMTGATSSQIQDVWDASILQQLSASGNYFADKCNLALSLSTDGVPLYKSSQVSM